MVTRKDEEIVREAKERFDRAKEWESVARINFEKDMKFANGDCENKWQWDDITVSSRGERPSLTVNKTRVHNLQILNDARQNKAAIKISPVGDNATYEAAKIFEGVCRHIEYISQATQAYDTATYNQVYGGIGYWTVRTEYVHDGSWDQEIYIQRVPDPSAIYLDPDIKQYDGSDANWGFIFADWTHSQFREKYPSHAEGAADPVGEHPIGNTDGWNDKDHIRVAEYFRVRTEQDTLHQSDSGVTWRESDLQTGGAERLEQIGVSSVRNRQIANRVVEWYVIAGDTIIDRKIWPGKYVPIVRVPCEETIIDNKLDRVSHTRHLRDPQRLYNWYTSAAAEFVALQGKAPYVAPVAAIEGQKGWEEANQVNHSVLTYNHSDRNGKPIPAPARAPPPSMASAYLEGLKISQAELMMVSGQYQAVMGAPSNETSGVAIQQRQRQGDNATYHVIDHLASAIRFTGRILIDLIPKIYDSPRILMIMSEDGSQSRVRVDPSSDLAHATMPQPGGAPGQPGPVGAPPGGAAVSGVPVNPQGQPDPQQAQRDAVQTIWNPAVGRYEVIAEVGPSFGTRREEAFNAYTQLLSQNKELFAVIGDLMMKAADFPGADEMAERLRNMVPPQALGGPPPAVQQLQQQLQMTQQQGQQIAQQADAEVAHLKAELVRLQEVAKERVAEMTVKEYDAETRRMAAVGSIDPMSMQIIVRQMVEEMLQTRLEPMLQAHAGIEQSLQTPAAADGMNGAGGPVQ